MRLRLSFPGDWRRPQVAERYQLFWSDSDRFGMLFPRPTHEQVAAFYNVANYYTHMQVNGDQGGLALPERLLLHVAWRLDRGVTVDEEWVTDRLTPSQRRVLDIGCGDGRLLARLRQAGFDCYGVEPDAHARRIAQERGLTVFDGTAERLPQRVTNQRYDMILMMHTLEHVVDPLSALANVYKLLAPGGRLVVETPNNAALGLRHAGISWRWLDVPRHLNFFTPHSLQLACRRAGFEVAAVEYRGYTRQFHPEWLREQQLISERYTRLLNGTSALPKGLQHSRWSQLRLLLMSLPQRAERKYDSVRVTAVSKA